MPINRRRLHSVQAGLARRLRPKAGPAVCRGQTEARPEPLGTTGPPGECLPDIPLGSGQHATRSEWRAGSVRADAVTAGEPLLWPERQGSPHRRSRRKRPEREGPAVKAPVNRPSVQSQVQSQAQLLAMPDRMAAQSGSRAAGTDGKSNSEQGLGGSARTRHGAAPGSWQGVLRADKPRLILPASPVAAHRRENDVKYAYIY